MVVKHRWVTDEPHIPFELDVLYEDAGIIVVDKPHFLATTPRGMWYRETALIRLRELFGEPDITPAHRLDRGTAGVLVFVRDPALRGAYQMLFQERRASKTYECLAPVAPIHTPRTGTLTRLEPPRPFPLLRRSHIVKDRGILQAYEIPGAVNAETVIEREILRLRATPFAQDDSEVVRCHPERRAEGPESKDLTRGRANHVTSPRHPVARYVLHPRTGKTHQLRVHMASLGLPIVGDDLYPRVVDRAYDDFSTPLQLVARTLEFTDPVSGEPRRFVSRIPLGGAA